MAKMSKREERNLGWAVDPGCPSTQQSEFPDFTRASRRGQRSEGPGSLPSMTGSGWNETSETQQGGGPMAGTSRRQGHAVLVTTSGCLQPTTCPASLTETSPSSEQPAQGSTTNPWAFTQPAAFSEASLQCPKLKEPGKFPAGLVYTA